MLTVIARLFLFLAVLSCVLAFAIFEKRIKVENAISAQVNDVIDHIVPSHSKTLNVPLFVSGIGRDQTYQLKFSVGTPAQHFNLTLDTTQWDTYLFSINPVFDTFDSCPTTMSNRHLYNPRASQTYQLGWNDDGQLADDEVSDCYADPTCHNGYFFATGGSFADVFELEGYSMNNTQAWMMTNLSGAINPGWVSDGVFGIIPDLIGLGLRNSPAMNLMQTFQTMLIYYSRSDAVPSGSSSGGSVTFGAKNSDHCSNDWTVVVGAGALNGPEGGEQSIIWTVNIASFVFGNMANVTVNLSGGFYSTTTFIHLPSVVFSAVTAEVGAEYDVNSDQYLVECDQRQSMPDMIFSLNNGAGGSTLMEYHVPATDYARKMSLTDGKCALLIVEDDKMVGYELWILGTTFNRPYCQLFNYNNGGNGTLAFSKAII